MKTSTNQQDINRPDYLCQAAAEMTDDIEYVRDVAKGTRHLRSLGTKYLPREEAETDRAYTIRLSRALLIQFFGRAVNALVGLVFKEEPQLGDDVPEIMRGTEATGEAAAKEGQLENCDLAGTHWTVFAKELFKDAMQDGHSFLLTEMPPSLGENATKADDAAANRRPYWVRYKADQAINWRIDGRGKLEQVTFEECSMEPDGEYGEEEVTRYRVLRPGSWELYRVVKDGQGKDMVVADPDSPGGDTSLSEIPVSVCYGRYLAPMVSNPPLLDLAVTNIAHYNEASDVSIYRHLVGRPVWWAAGRDTTKKAPVLSPYTIIDVKEGGSLGVAESSGAALGDARLALKDMEEHMGMLGLQMLAEQTAGDKTATEERGDQIRELSELATAAQSLKDCLEQGLKFWAQYLDPAATSGGSVSLGVKTEQLTSEAAARMFLDSVGVVFSEGTVRKVLAKAYAAIMPEDYSDENEAKTLEEDRGKARANAPEIGQASLSGGRAIERIA